MPELQTSRTFSAYANFPDVHDFGNIFYYFPNYCMSSLPRGPLYRMLISRVQFIKTIAKTHNAIAIRFFAINAHSLGRVFPIESVFVTRPFCQDDI